MPGQQLRQLALFRLLAVSKATGHRLAAAGKLGPRPVRLGGCLRYDLREVLAWLEARRPDGTLHDAKTWPAVWAAMRRERRARS
jgi:predicted DNA-binding transcriptional regulator AlpA